MDFKFVCLVVVVVVVGYWMHGGYDGWTVDSGQWLIQG
jgi:hypothetical protein